MSSTQETSAGQARLTNAVRVGRHCCALVCAAICGAALHAACTIDATPRVQGALCWLAMICGALALITHAQGTTESPRPDDGPGGTLAETARTRRPSDE